MAMTKNEAAISCGTRRAAVAEDARAAPNRQRTTKPPAASTSESAPKPTSAIEPATAPAPIAIAASMPCQPTPSHASARARRTSVGTCMLVVAAITSSCAPGEWGRLAPPCFGSLRGERYGTYYRHHRARRVARPGRVAAQRAARGGHQALRRRDRGEEPHARHRARGGLHAPRPERL